METMRAPVPPGDPEPASGQSQRSALTLAGFGLVGATVALSLGLYGRLHTPTGMTIEPLEPTQLIAVKSVLTSVGAGLALFQLITALWLYGKLAPLPASPSWLGPTHRWSGTAAFLCTLPAAYHCLWALGYQDYSTRVIVHSVLGCAFYGAFATKMLVLRSDRLPGWALPLAGAGLVLLVVALWLTSAFWYFTDIDLLAFGAS